MINAADCVVVLLTPEGLRSVEVRDELSRCHDRGKLIIPVVVEGTSLAELPWHMRDLIPNLINKCTTHSDTSTHRYLPWSRMHKYSLEMV
jgi:hypothetical protein